jgi:hypothetical protein
MRKVNGRLMPSDGKSSPCLWQGELKKGLFSKRKPEKINCKRKKECGKILLIYLV